MKLYVSRNSTYTVYESYPSLTDVQYVEVPWVDDVNCNNQFNYVFDV
jgi:hypothetical protein